MRAFIFASFALALVSGCASTRPVELAYQASTSATAFEVGTSLTVGTVRDERTNGANWIGAIRGGYGNPLKVLETEKPVKDVVKELFVQGLAARQLAPDSEASRTLDVSIVELNSSQYVRREAHVELSAEVVDAASGKVLWSGRGSADDVNGSILAMNTGIFADPEALRSLLDATLQTAIDEILDDPDMRRALKQ